jgi:hypothetical protein
MFAYRTLRIPIGIVKNVYLHVGPHIIHTELVVMDMPHEPSCPIIFRRIFLNAAGANINCKMRVYLLSLGKCKLNFTSPNLESNLTVNALLIRREEPFIAHPPII